MMARPQEPRLRWTPEEDQKLIEIRLKYPGRPWPGTAELAGLDRTDKSCWERYYNHLKPGVSKANFFPEEDDIIIRFHSSPGNRWAFIRENCLPWRTANDIKNRWNNHLKKWLATIDQNIPHLPLQTLPSNPREMGNASSTSEIYLEFCKGHLLTDDETSDHSVWGDDLETLMAEFASLIHNVDPNASLDS